MLDINEVQDEISTHLGWSKKMKDDLYRNDDHQELEKKEVATYEDGG